MSAATTPASAASSSADLAASASNLSPMQKELLSRADSIFASIGDAVSKASDAAMSAGQAVAKEVPDIAFQYIAFGRAYSTLWVVLAVLAACFAYYGVIQVAISNKKNLPNSDYYTWHGERICFLILGVILTMFAVVAFSNNIRDFIMSWFAPKVWLILELTQLIQRLRN